MHDLFFTDLSDYDPLGKMLSRPLGKMIIVRDLEILLLYSQKYDYYKFPDIVIEDFKDHNKMTEYGIFPDSMEEYGRVVFQQKDPYDEKAVFLQEHFYYFCQIKDAPPNISIADHEKEEDFTPVWINPLLASKHNLYETSSDGEDLFLIKTDAKVMDMVDQEIRKRNHKANRVAFLDSLGYPCVTDMLDFVENALQTDTERISTKIEIAYSRFEHTVRVLAWAKRLYDHYEHQDEVRYEELIIGTIFHDVGRNFAEKEGIPHAKAGVPITKQYLFEHGYSKEQTEFISFLVASHSDKHLMNDPSIDKTLLLLMEADLLDDTGAQGIVMDCMITEKRNPEATFSDCLDHINRYTHRIQQFNPMVTTYGKKLWDEKTKLVEAFTKSLAIDTL